MSRSEVRLKAVAEIRSSGVDKHVHDDEIPVRLCNYMDVYNNERLTSQIAFSSGSVSPAEFHRFRLTVNDVVITKDSETPDDIGVASILAEPIAQLVCAYHLAVIRPGASLDGRYLQRAFQTANAKFYWRNQAKGVTRFALSIDDIGGFPIPIVALPEQRRIADFLDARCAAIDAAIEKKERMVEAEEERRQIARDQLIAATTSRAVPLRRLMNGSPRNGISPPTTNSGSTGSVLSFSLSAIRNGVVNLCEETLKTVDVSSHSHLPFIVQRGDVFVVRGSGNIDLVGRAARLRDEPPDNCVYPDIAIRLSLGPELDPDYLVHVFDSNVVRHQIDAVARTSNGAYKISGDDLKDLAIPTASIDEQRRTAALLTLDGTRSDAITAALTRSIAALREYRTALITAAVTGQLSLDAPSPPPAEVAL